MPARITTAQPFTLSADERSLILKVRAAREALRVLSPSGAGQVALRLENAPDGGFETHARVQEGRGW